ncbi:hypothetical protein [Pseudoduganella chitinolytica]|uniref:Uncharacterized protein n=1 Tax=Pseudoduganella chitinolytica TaxID=34070 RepID=A0ABY8BG15_9BURK|nr:hypothetical protein [Pseudoduganella chitinolytica]WEF34857.1 hypothetical protein PX653_08875 [Pseudoduganella chitinolytica]
MRAPTITTVQYAPGPVPVNQADLPRYLEEEFNKIAAAVALLRDGGYAVTYALPDKPREGMVRYFDGVQVNPTGAGGGIHYYNGSQWIRLG